MSCGLVRVSCAYDDACQDPQGCARVGRFTFRSDSWMIMTVMMFVAQKYAPREDRILFELILRRKLLSPSLDPSSRSTGVLRKSSPRPTHC